MDRKRSKKFTIIGLTLYMVIIMSLQMFVVESTAVQAENGQISYNYAWFIGLTMMITIGYVLFYGRVYDLITRNKRK